jgi:HlyD family secretion protein
MRAPYACLTVVFAFGLGLAGPSFSQTQDVATAPAEITLPAITVSTVEMRDMRDIVLASGLIGAVEEVQIQPLIEGQPIESLEADVGDFVNAGQVLARLSLTTLQLQKSQYLASLESARATVAQGEALVLEAQSVAEEAGRINQRTDQLKAQGSATQAAADTARANAVSAKARVTVAVQTLVAAKAQLSLAEAQLANIDLQLERTDVVAPVAGKIVERNARIGSVASSAGAPMFVMLKDGALELRAEVAESDLMRLAVGQPVAITAIGTSSPLTGVVRLVEPRIDQTTRMGTARIEIKESDLVRSGMFAEAQILAAERKTLSLPVTAVSSGREGATVMKVTDGKVGRVGIVTGIREGGFIEIIEGLVEGDTVVTKAGAFVRDGDRINPVPAVAVTN